MSTFQAEVGKKVGLALASGKRYIVLYGGRGSGKTWNIARKLIIWACERQVRIMCCREVMNSLAESVHQTLVDQIEMMGVSWQFHVTAQEIKNTVTGAQFWFAGLKTNIDSIKSKEGIDILWVEEANNVSKMSWAKAIPTIRKEGSQIIVSFNPELETDETYQRFVVRGRNDPGIELVKVNWQNNEFFTGPLEDERLRLMNANMDEYLWTYEGHCKQVLEGAVYEKEIREATTLGRITKVPYDPSKPVNTFWDLGWRDSTAIWFAQAVGFEYRIIDYVEAQGRKIEDYITLLAGKSYNYGVDYLPHDGASESLASRSIAHLLRDANRTVTVLPVAGIADGINAVRTIFPNCWFDEENTGDGLNRLRRYRYGIDEKKNDLWSKTPLHDENSHAADAFRQLAMSLRPPKVIKPRVALRRGSPWG